MLLCSALLNIPVVVTTLSLSLSLAPFSQTLVVDLSTIAPHVSGPNSVKVTHSLKSIAAQRKQVDKVRGNHAHNN